MSKLIKPAQYAKQYNISRQAVYAKIKRGTLRSKEVDGQLFIILDVSSEFEKEEAKKTSRDMEIKSIDIENHYTHLLRFKRRDHKSPRSTNRRS